MVRNFSTSVVGYLQKKAGRVRCPKVLWSGDFNDVIEPIQKIQHFKYGPKICPSQNKGSENLLTDSVRKGSEILAIVSN